LTLILIVSLIKILFYEPTWVGRVVLAWDLGVCSSSMSQVRISPVPIWVG